MAAVYQDVIYWGVHFLAIIRAMGAWIYSACSFSGSMAMVNLGISMLVYNSTKVEQKEKLKSDSELSTRPKRPFFLPCSFIFLSIATGVLNFGGAFFRSRHIHLLELPTTWLEKYMSSSSTGDIDAALLEELIDAEWVVAVNDWGSLFLVVAFFLSGCFNFATVRQLRLRDREAKKRAILPLVDGSCLGLEDVRDVVEFEKIVSDEKLSLVEGDVNRERPCP